MDPISRFATMGALRKKLSGLQSLILEMPDLNRFVDVEALRSLPPASTLGLAVRHRLRNLLFT